MLSIFYYHFLESSWPSIKLEVESKFSHCVLGVSWGSGRDPAIFHPSPANPFKDASIREKVTGVWLLIFMLWLTSLKQRLTKWFQEFESKSINVSPQEMLPSVQHIVTSGPSMTSEVKSPRIGITELNSTTENKSKLLAGESSSSWRWVLQGVCSLVFWKYLGRGKDQVF